MSGSLPGVRIAWADVPSGAERRTVAWSLVRSLLDEAGDGAEARLSNLCAYCGGPHGPVRIEGAPFLASVAYARGVAVAAIVGTQDARAFGIDAEPTDAARPGRLLGAGATVRDWVRVEAALKADGRGLRVDPASIEICEDGGGWLAWVPGRSAPLRGLDVEGPVGAFVSVAAEVSATAAAEAQGDRATR